MDGWALIAERKILEAFEEGKFDDLACKGRPLPEEDFSGVPEDLRLGYKVLKNAGVLPRQMQLKKEIAVLKAALAKCPEGPRRRRLSKRLALKMVNYEALR